MGEELYDLPKGWVWVKLEDVVETVENINPSINPEQEFIYLDIASIDNSLQKITQPKTYLGENAPSRARQLVKAGDILFSTVRTYLKNIAVVPDIYHNQIASTGFCVIRSHKEISQKFIFLITQNDNFLEPLNQLQRGTSYPAVRDSDVFTQNIPLPPLAEQHRIVAKIEELFTQLDAGVELLKKVKAKLKRYRQAVLKAAVEGNLTKEWREANQGELEPASVLLERILKQRREKWEAEQLAKMKAQG
jgi:type I restriction enzyme S subunit